MINIDIDSKFAYDTLRRCFIMMIPGLRFMLHLSRNHSVSVAGSYDVIKTISTGQRNLLLERRYN